MKKRPLSLIIALFLIFICGAVFTACDEAEKAEQNAAYESR